MYVCRKNINCLCTFKNLYYLVRVQDFYEQLYFRSKFGETQFGERREDPKKNYT